jgi:hypothetical protein
MTKFIRKDQKINKHKPSPVQKPERVKGSVWGKIRSIILLTLFFLFSAMLYVATIKGLPGNPDAKEIRALDKATKPFELSPERGRYAHTYALAENGSFSLTPDLAEAVYPDVGYVDGRFYSFFAPGVSFFAVPFYEIGKQFNLGQVFAFGTISLFALGSLFFMYRIARDIFKLTTGTSLIPPLIFAFGSTSWSYATTMYQHHVTIFFILSAFYAVWKYAQKTRFSFLWASYIWLSYALAFMVDYPNLILMLPVMVYFLLSSIDFEKIKDRISISIRPAFLFSVVFFLIVSVLHGYYNYTQLGSWKQLSGTIIGYKVIKERQLFATQAGQAQIKEIEQSKTTTSFFREDQLPHGLFTLLVAPDKGILLFSPVFALGITALIGLLKQINRPLAILLSLTGVNLFLYSSFGDPWGGWAYGPRYLSISMAVLSLIIGIWLSQVRYRIVTKFIIFLLFAYSSAIALMGVLTTNAIPPKVEADYLRIKYGYFMAFDFFKDGGSSSYLYNTFAASHLTLYEYFGIIYAALLFVFTLVLITSARGGNYEN